MTSPLETDPRNLYDLTGRTAVVTGGGGVLCGAMARALAAAGAAVAVLDLREEEARTVADDIAGRSGNAVAMACDALDRSSLEECRDRIAAGLGPAEILVCGVGGNHPDATTSSEKTFDELPEDAVRRVFDLNFMSTFLTCQVFGRQMAEAGRGAIINVSSMNAYRPLTRIPAYSAAKAAVSNFTAWLATHMALEYSPRIRVNAVAPGFFLTLQNRFLLQDEKTGEWTPRGRTILEHTPAGRFGEPADLVGTTLWLAGDASAFVTGIVVPVDGGFSGFSGV